MTQRKADPVGHQSTNPLDERIEQLKQLFPEAVNEDGIDFDSLRNLLGIEFPQKERFNFTWSGKQNAILRLQKSSIASLKPAPEESKNWNATGNLFIEGDNLEVLKLLYKAYFGRVKMIYIDPPYNTEKDFVYPDDYSTPLDTYLHVTGQIDKEGNQLTTDLETTGRKHSGWLSMMYPRLFLARQLLKDDGVIFVSIDDREIHNLRMLMNEIFGEENFLGTIVWKKKTNGNNMGYIPPVHDYFVVYARTATDDSLLGFPMDEEYIQSNYSNPDNDPRGVWTTQDLSANHKGPYFPIKNPNTGVDYYPPDGRYWVFSEEEVQQRIAAGRIIFGKRGLTAPTQKIFLSEKTSMRKKAESWWDQHGLNSDGTKEIGELVGTKVFDHPKPSQTIKHLCDIATKDNDIVLDFFAGSGTTAQAVLELNREDRLSKKTTGNRKFILVQLPEKTPPNSVARNAGFDTIFQIAHTRITNLIKQLEENKVADEDLGFRVFKLAKSPLRQWEELPADKTSPEEYARQMELFVTDPLLDGWTEQDVIAEVAIKEVGFSLTYRVEKVEAVANQSVYKVVDDEKGQHFYICLDDRITLEALKPLALTRDDLFIFRDSAITDTIAANLALTCRIKSI